MFVHPATGVMALDVTAHSDVLLETHDTCIEYLGIDTLTSVSKVSPHVSIIGCARNKAFKWGHSPGLLQGSCSLRLCSALRLLCWLRRSYFQPKV